MASELEKRFSSQGLHAWSVTPGLVRTGLPRSIPNMSVDDFYKVVLQDETMRKAMKDTEQGAATSVRAAICQDHEGGRNGGLYLSNCAVKEEGYAPFAYDAKGAAALWEHSEKVVAAVPAAA